MSQPDVVTRSRAQGWARAGAIAAVLALGVGLAGCNQNRSPMLQPVAPVPTVTATGNG